ncbi:unnamed protein product [Brassicogethes aeneus]|uniref:DUF4371 domain-containing protein n=1 Tax=Brassicogethes aeneus TaxID=1431903 RepID=A0A9P0FNS6_BRAAE|nr:unnamed protein product [Brassicogethes aeneus]
MSNDFEWIDSTKEFLFCKLCQIKLSGSRFHLKRHERNSTHQKASKAVKTSQHLKSLVGDGSKNKLLKHQIKTAEIKLCCFICEENLPLLLMDTLPLLNKEIYPDSKIAQGVSMKRSKATKIITGVLGQTFKKEVINDLKKSRFSIIIDEITDISTKRSLVVVVRYWSDDHQKIVD